jgi:hypothetical protein
MLFPFAEYWWVYASFTALVLVLLALDLGVFHRRAHVVSIREAALWSVFWVTLSLLANWGLYEYARWAFATDPRLAGTAGFDPEDAAARVALEFLAGYVVEKSLAVDNIFVFVVVFSYFSVPQAMQHRVPPDLVVAGHHHGSDWRIDRSVTRPEPPPPSDAPQRRGGSGGIMAGWCQEIVSTSACGSRMARKLAPIGLRSRSRWKCASTARRSPS